MMRVAGLGEPVDLLQGGEGLDPQAQKAQSQRFGLGDDARDVWQEKSPQAQWMSGQSRPESSSCPPGSRVMEDVWPDQGDEMPLLAYPAPARRSAPGCPAGVSIREKGAASPVSASTTSFSISAPIPHFSARSGPPAPGNRRGPAVEAIGYLEMGLDQSRHEIRIPSGGGGSVRSGRLDRSDAAVIMV